jgi:FtsP/CotA-like multicopper oxidase with cupredoxin domain
MLLITWLMSMDGLAQKNVYDTVYMQNFGNHTLYDKSVVQLYSFTYTQKQPAFLPGKTIEAEEGDSVFIFVKSVSNDGFHTVHLHGLDVDMINDGEPYTSFPIAPYQEYEYKFKATHAGTYIYHCHVGDVMHVQMGMYALLVVKPKGNTKTAWTNGPGYDFTYSWLSSELDKYWHENTPYAMMNSFKIPVYAPAYFLINGKSKQQLVDTSTAILAEKNKKTYVRIANIGFYKHDFIFPKSLNAQVIDSDGRPLKKPFETDTLSLVPGERYGVMISSPNELNTSVKVNFIDMYTQVIKGSESIPVNIVTAVAIDESQKSQHQFRVYPNPVKEELNVEIQDKIKGDYQLIIKDLSGRNLLQQICNGSDTKKLFISELPKGIYMLELKTNQSVSTQKFIKN